MREAAAVLAGGLGALDNLQEHRLRPGARVRGQPQHAVEIITYVREGSLAYRDAEGNPALLTAGEFQCRSVGRGARQDSTNASTVGAAHVFEVWLRLSAWLGPSQQQKRFSAAERRGALCIVASPDGRRGSLRIHENALLYSALLNPGQHVVHELAPGHGAWLHLLEGEVALDDVILGPGDGVGISADRAVSLTARGPVEALLLDLWQAPAPA